MRENAGACNYVDAPPSAPFASVFLYITAFLLLSETFSLSLCLACLRVCWFSTKVHRLWKQGGV